MLEITWCQNPTANGFVLNGFLNNEEEFGKEDDSVLKRAIFSDRGWLYMAKGIFILHFAQFTLVPLGT